MNVKIIYLVIVLLLGSVFIPVGATNDDSTEQEQVTRELEAMLNAVKQYQLDTGRALEITPDTNVEYGYLAIDNLIEDPGSSTSTTIKANWKIVVENYIDHYHLSHLHSGTLSMYDHARAEFGFVGPHFAFYEPLSEEYQRDLKTNAPMPLILAPEEAGAWVSMVFPGLGLAESHQLVVAQGGALYASTSSGGGARFTLRLPLLQEGAFVATADDDKNSDARKQVPVSHPAGQESRFPGRPQKQND